MYLSLDSRLNVAVDLSRALFDLHSLSDGEGRSAVVHADIAVRQFLSFNGKFKLNDFNTAGMIYKKADQPDKICPYMIPKANDKVSVCLSAVMSSLLSSSSNSCTPEQGTRRNDS
jgi:hypothetical protein